MSLVNPTPLALMAPAEDPFAPVSDFPPDYPTGQEIYPQVNKLEGKKGDPFAGWIEKKSDDPFAGWIDASKSSPKKEVNPMTGEGGSVDPFLGQLMGAHNGPATKAAETVVEGAQGISARADKVGGLQAGGEAALGALMTIPGMVPQVISLLERTGRYGYAKLVGMHKDNPEALREYVKDAGFSEALTKALRSVIGINDENKGAYEGAQQIVGAPFIGALDSIGENAGPGAELAAEAAMIAAPIRAARNARKPQPKPPQSFFDDFVGPRQEPFVGPERPTNVRPDFEMTGPPREPFVGPEPRPGHGLPQQGELFAPDIRYETDMGPPRPEGDPVTRPNGALYDQPWDVGETKDLFDQAHGTTRPKADGTPPDLAERRTNVEREIRHRDAGVDIAYKNRAEYEAAVRQRQEDAAWEAKERTDAAIKNPEAGMRWDYDVERPTAMADAFSKAKGDGRLGMMDPSLIAEGVANTFKKLGHSWPALLKRFEGTFDPLAISAAKTAVARDPHTKLVLLSPDDFHKMAASREKQATEYMKLVKEGVLKDNRTEAEMRAFHEASKEEHRKSIRAGLATKDGLRELPELHIDARGQVIGHEGRHRMDVFKEMGVDKIPVVVVDRSSGLIWKSQDGAGGSMRAPRLETNPDPLGVLREKEIGVHLRKAQEQYERWNSPEFRKPMDPERARIFADIRRQQEADIKRAGGGILNSGIDPTEVTKAGLAAYNRWKAGWKKGDKEAVNTERLSGLTDETTHDFMNRMDEMLWKKDDIDYKLGMSSASFRTLNQLIKNPTSWAHHVIHHFDTQVKKALRYEHRLNAALQPAFDVFHRYYRKGKWTGADFEKFRVDLRVALDVEKNPQAWGGGPGKWYPSARELQQMGMSPDAAKAWRGVYDAFEKTFDVLEKTLQSAGVKMPPRVPGYLPHLFKGPYSVKVRRSTAKSAAHPDGYEYLGELNFYNRKERDAAVKQLESRLEKGQELEMGEPNVLGNQVHDLLSGLYRAADITESAKGITNLMQSLYESSAKGIIGSALERAKEPKFGHLLERVASDDPLMALTPRQMKQAVMELQNATEAVNAWSARVEFVTKTLFPLEQAGFLPEGSKMQKAARSFMEAYFKIPDNWGKAFDVFMKDKLVKLGQNPALLHDVMEIINSGFAQYYLRLNLPFYAVNTLQSTVSLPALFAKKAIGDMYGEQTGSVAKAISDAKAGMKQSLAMDMTKNPIMKWAMENGYLDPIFVEQMDASRFKDGVATAIERRTRWNAFNVGYHYYKQFKPHEAALKLAGEFANEVAVPYSHQVGAPNILSKIPVVGRPLAMFATYQAHMFGMLNQQRLLGMQAIKQKNPRMLLNVATAAAGLQALNMTLFGLGGVSLVQNWNDVANFLNNQLGYELPTSEEAGRYLDEKMGTDGLATYGLASKILGYDISSSAQGIAFQAPLAGANAFASLAQSLWLSGKWASYKVGLSDRAPTKKDAWETLKKTPPQIRSKAEWMLRSNMLDPAKIKAEGLAGDFGTMVMKDVNMPGDPRTKEEQWLYGIFGIKSVDEKQFDASHRITAYTEQRQNKDIGNLAQRFREQGPTPENINAAIEQSAKLGNDPEAHIKTMIRYWLERELSPVERKMMGNTSSPRGIQKIEQYEKEREKEGLRGEDRINRNAGQPWDAASPYVAQVELALAGEPSKVQKSVRQHFPKGQERNLLLNGTAIPNLKIAEYDGDMDDVTRGFMVNESEKDIIYVNKHQPGDKQHTYDHEAEHILQKKGMGGVASRINSKFDELTKTDGSLRRQVVRSLVDVGPYLAEKYGVDNAYFTKKMWDFQGKLAPNLLYEQLASLGAVENQFNVDLTQDRYLRKHVFDTPIKRQAFRAMVGLRQTRLDARDLPPYTMIKDR